MRRLLVPAHAALLVAAAALVPTAGSSQWVFAGLLAAGVPTVAAELWLRRRGRRAEGRAMVALRAATCWSLCAAPPVALEILGILGEPGSRAFMALATVWFGAAGVSFVVGTRAGARGSAARSGWPVRLSVLGCAAAGTLLVAECILRGFVPAFPYEVVAEDGSPPDLFEPDDVVGLRMVPGFRGHYVHPDFPGQSVRINANGYRDRLWIDPSIPSASGVRILVLGDSFAFGTGVEDADTFARLLERTESRRGRVHGFNAGVPGYCPVSAAVVLEGLLDVVRPDVVILTLYTGNDPEDALKLVERRARSIREAAVAARARAQLAERGLTEREEPTRAGLPGRVDVDLLLRRAFSYGYWQRSSRACALLLSAVTPILVRWHLVDPVLVYETFLIRTVALSPDPVAAAALDLALAAVQRAHDLCRQRGAEFLLFLAPPVMLVDLDMLEGFFTLQQRFARDDYSPDVLHDRIRAFAEQHGIAVLDPLDGFRAAFRNGETLYHQEGHWNEAGHRAVAAWLAEDLARRGWL